MSPMLAYRRRVPPSTLMHSTSRAPELSATRSRLSCWIIGLFDSFACSSRSFEHLDDAPVLQLRQGAGFGQADTIALVRVVGLVVRVQVTRALHRLAVTRVAHAVDDRDDDCLVHLGGNHDPFADLPLRRALRCFVGHRVSSITRLALPQRRSRAREGASRYA